jgi:hypothetical protein
MKECMICSSDITTKESEEFNNHCTHCYQGLMITALANELREARITFEEVTRRLIEEVDR